MKPTRISKQVAKVLDELWPVVVRAHKRAGGKFNCPKTWQLYFRDDLKPAGIAVWVSFAKFHLRKLAAKSKDSK